MQPYPSITTVLETVLALLALTEIVCATGAVPVIVQGLVLSEVAVFPGVIVIVHVPLAARDGPQFELAVVPEGQVG